MSAGLAVSNIAWEPAEEPDVARTLAELDVHFAEIAPTKVFDDPTDVSARALRDYLGFWGEHGISVVAFQSLLFGRPELSIFGEPSQRRETVDRLGAFIELAGRIGAARLVFGSPRNRRRPDGIEDAAVQAQAVEVFRELGRRAEDAGVIFCIEPNPPQYGCDFVTTAAEGASLVREVAMAGFGLHLDAAGMTLAGDTPVEAIRYSSDVLCHYHVSAPELGAIEDTVVDHTSAFTALREIGYQQVVSIEMRQGDPGSGSLRVRDAVERVRRHASAANFSLDAAGAR